MNIFKEMALSVYSFKSYKEFLKNKKGKVFGFGLMLVLIYFAVTTIIPFAVREVRNGGLAKQIEENVPDFELEDGVLWVGDVIEYDAGNSYICIDTDPESYFYDAAEMEYYLSDYTTAILMDSEKMIAKSNGEVMGVYFSDMDFEFSKEDLLGWVPFAYAVLIVAYILIYIWEAALFFFGVLFVALLGMIVASCMKYQLTFGQLYLLGVYSRTLPLIIKAALSFIPVGIPFFVIINFGLSLLIIGCAIQKMKEQNLTQPLQFTSDNSEADNSNGVNISDSNSNSSSINNTDDFTWMQ